MNLKRKSNWNLGCNLALVGVLTATILFFLWAQNLGKYTLQPGQSVELKVFSKTEQLEYNSELILEKKDDAKVKLSGRKGLFHHFLNRYFYSYHLISLCALCHTNVDDKPAHFEAQVVDR